MTTAAALRAGRSRLLALCAALTDLAVRLDADPTSLAEARANIDDLSVRVVVVAEINRGKSTLLNALVGAKLFPSRVVVCTAAVTELRDGELRAEVHSWDGRVESLCLPEGDASQSLRAVVSKKNTRADDVERVRVWSPNRFARDGVVLVDTPGVNDPEPRREEATRRAVQSADAAIFLLDPQTPLRLSERLFLQEAIHHRVEDRVLFVVNKIDQVSADDVEAALDRLRRELSRVIASPRIIPLAAKPALSARLRGDAGGLESSGLAAFEEELERFLVEERVALHLTARRRTLRLLAAELAEGLSLRRRALQSQRESLKERLGVATRRLHAERGRLERERGRKEEQLVLLPGRIASAVESAWARAEQEHLLSEEAVATVAAMTGDGERLRQEVRDRVGRTRRQTERAVERQFEELRTSLVRAARDDLAEVNELIEQLAGDLLPPGADSMNRLGRGSFEVASDALNYPTHMDFSEGLVRSVVGLGAALVGIASVAVGGLAAVASELAGWDAAVNIRRMLRLSGRAAQPRLESDLEHRANAMIRSSRARLKARATRRIEAAENALQGLRASISTSQMELEKEQARLAAIDAELRSILEELS